MADELDKGGSVELPTNVAENPWDRVDQAVAAPLRLRIIVLLKSLEWSGEARKAGFSGVETSYPCCPCCKKIGFWDDSHTLSCELQAIMEKLSEESACLT